MFAILLISYANWDSLMEFPAIFKKAGCTIDVFCAKDSWAIQNTFYDTWIDSGNNNDQFVDNLLNYIAKYGDKYNWFLPGDDKIVRLLNENITDEALFYKLLPLSKIENRELLGSKAGFSNMCKKYNIETPKYLVYEAGMTTKEIITYMGFPFMIKADKSEAGYGVYLCRNEDEFIVEFNKVENKVHTVFQQYIQGYNVNMETLYKNGELIVHSYSRLLKIYGKFGYSTKRLFYQNKEILSEVQKIGKSFGINGFANVSFMYSVPEKKHYLIEVDIRPNTWMYYGHITGNDFVEGVKKIMCGDYTYLQPAKEYDDKKVIISLYKKDLHRCIVEKDLKGFLNWVFNKDNCWRYIPFYDKKALKSSNKFLWGTFMIFAKSRLRKIFKIKK